MSPLVRSIIDSLGNIRDNKGILPDFSYEEINRPISRFSYEVRGRRAGGGEEKDAALTQGSDCSAGSYSTHLEGQGGSVGSGPLIRGFKEDAFVVPWGIKTKAFPCQDWGPLGGECAVVSPGLPSPGEDKEGKFLSLDQDKIFPTRYHYAQCFYHRGLLCLLYRLG